MWKQQLALLVRKKSVVVGGASALSFIAGAGSSYLFTKKRLQTKYEKLADAEIQEAKAHYSRLYKTDEYSDPEKLADKLIGPDREKAQAVVTSQGYDPNNIFKPKEPEEAPEEEIDETDGEGEVVVEADTGVVEAETINVFTAGAGGVAIPQEEIDARGTEPYIISEEEFLTNENDWKQHSLTWFEGDGVLCDDQDQLVDNTDIVGNNFEKFGIGTRDRNLVHICNPTLEVLYEVVKSEGEFTQEVLGLKHSDDDLFRRAKHQRWDDEGR